MSNLKLHDPDGESKAQVCTLCQKPRTIHWYLTNYFGFYGDFCYWCFESVSHSSRYKADGSVEWYPRHPRKYANALKRYNERNNNAATGRKTL